MFNLLILYYRQIDAGCTSRNEIIVYNSWDWYRVGLHLTFMVVHLWIPFHSDVSSHAYTCSNWTTTGKISPSTIFLPI